MAVIDLSGNWSLLPQALQQLAGATPMSRLQELREKMLVGPMGPRDFRVASKVLVILVEKRGYFRLLYGML